MVSQFHRYLFSLKNRFASPAKVIAARGFSKNLKGGSSIFMKLLEELPGGYDSLSRESARQEGNMDVRPLNEGELEVYLRAWLRSVGVDTGNMNLAEMQREMRNIEEFLSELKAHFQMGNFSGEQLARVKQLIRDGSVTEARLQARINELSAQLGEYVALINHLQQQLSSEVTPEKVAQIQARIQQLQGAQGRLQGSKDESELHYRDVKMETLDDEIKRYIAAILEKLNESDPAKYMQNTLSEFLSRVNQALSAGNASGVNESLLLFRNQLQQYLDLLQKNPASADVGFLIPSQFAQTGNKYINDIMVEIATLMQNILKTKKAVSPNTSRLREMLKEREFNAPDDDAALVEFLCNDVLAQFDAQKSKIDELEGQIRKMSQTIVENQNEIESLQTRVLAYRNAVTRWISQLTHTTNNYAGLADLAIITKMNDLIYKMDTNSQLLSSQTSSEGTDVEGIDKKVVVDAIHQFMTLITQAFKNYTAGIIRLNDPAQTQYMGDLSKPEKAIQLSRELAADIKGIQLNPVVTALVHLYPGFGQDLSIWIEEIQQIVNNYNFMLEKSQKFYGVIESIAGLLSLPVTENMQPIIDGVKELKRGINEMYESQMQQLRESLAQAQKEKDSLASSLAEYSRFGTTQRIEEELNRVAQYVSEIKSMQQQLSQLQSQVNSTGSIVEQLTPTNPPPTAPASSLADESTIGPALSDVPSMYPEPSAEPSAGPSAGPSADSSMDEEDAIVEGYQKEILQLIAAVKQYVDYRFLRDLTSLRDLTFDICISKRISPEKKATLILYLYRKIANIYDLRRGWHYSVDGDPAKTRFYMILPVIARIGFGAVYNYLDRRSETTMGKNLLQGYGNIIIDTLTKLRLSLTALFKLPWELITRAAPNVICDAYNEQVKLLIENSEVLSLPSQTQLDKGDETKDMLGKMFDSLIYQEILRPTFKYDVIDWIKTVMYYGKNSLKGSSSFWLPGYKDFAEASFKRIRDCTDKVFLNPSNLFILVAKGLNPFKVLEGKLTYGYFSVTNWASKRETILDYYTI